MPEDKMDLPTEDMLTAAFEDDRSRLRRVAYRILGSAGEADDAVQDAWLRLHRSDPSEIDNLAGWLTTVVSRICLDQLRTRRTRREDSLDARPTELRDDEDHGPEQQAVQADSMGAALMIILDTLAPTERLAFVLHDLFAVPFDEIAPIIDKTPAASRQLASRARRRVRGGSTYDRSRTDTDGTRDQTRQTEVVAAFLDATRNSRFDRLLTLLAPDVVLRADPMAVAAAKASADRGAPRIEAELRGAKAIAKALAGSAQAAQVALVDGFAGATWAPGGQPRSVFEISIRDGRIVSIDLYADPDLVASFDVEILT
ncbi:sigma-70 family RNA polymerase sigma factor [Microlunatus parietis]|uniref:RNA polymerase sigma-70 factor (ECF subfamily) n=1 Tax=Microlunatus parietis TaxID=682979 RepID=A0A7Y9I3Q8_9ACTN|nr:sigma-70 family RNA polymerase sigma factor [Microlunatus parietis]NYE69701.1 RNA polymerase sigma-70 factor (ECF subfamily) [Microlunatus parietis]